jgi:hypothetical protein
MPRARPDTTTSPASPNSRARSWANLRASAEALRAPTIAIMSRRGSTPSTDISGGGGASAATPCQARQFFQGG